MVEVVQTPEQLKWRVLWEAAQASIGRDPKLRGDEKRLVLEYVRTAIEAIRANEPLFKAIRSGALRPHALGTALEVLITLSIGDVG